MGVFCGRRGGKGGWEGGGIGLGGVGRGAKFFLKKIIINKISKKGISSQMSTF